MRIAACLIFTIAICNSAHTQTQIRGYIFASRSTLTPAANAIVYLSSGTHVYTSQLGHFALPVPWADSLHVYYQGSKWTIYITDTMLTAGLLNVYMDDTTSGQLLREQLAPVFVKSKSYNQLVEEHRQDYSDALNYRPTHITAGNNKWHDSVASIGGKVALDTKKKKLGLLNINSATHALVTKTGRQKRRLKNRLIEDEHTVYVQHIFTPALVKKYTSLRNDDSLHRFVTTYAPPFDSLVVMTELDLGAYIIRKVGYFRQH